MNTALQEIPALSICLPVYNAAPYLCECLESILSQDFSDYELIIVDDGSTDGSREVIQSYRDDRIRFETRPHDYIGNINYMFDIARGKYIVRMDADDRMTPGRLRFQYNYMENHPEIDILGGSLRYFGTRKGVNILALDGFVTPRQLLNGCCVANSTSILRRERIEACHIRYDRTYLYAEDYHFWVQAVLAGLRVTNVKEILTEYRTSASQVSTAHCIEQMDATKKVKHMLSHWLSRKEEERNQGRTTHIPTTGNRLTTIIPFLNEREEVGLTVKSIRESVGNAVDILVINDQSDDGYDYEADLTPYDVSYIYNTERKGVAGSRNYGVSLCTTPYFLLLDAHMRFYDSRWAERLEQLLDEDDRCVLCCQSRFLIRDENGKVVVALECPNTFGAYFPFQRDEYLPDIMWNYHERDKKNDVEPIPAIYGAGYALSKRYWDYIKGLEGLLCYGSDEAFLSLKAWTEGGKCLLVKDVIIGHVYRKSAPYHRSTDEETFNHLFISYLFFPPSLYCRSCAIALKKDPVLYVMAQRIMRQRKEEIEAQKDHIRSIAHRSFQEVLELHKEVMQRIPRDTALSRERLQEVTDYLLTCPEEDFGLYEGKAARIIWFAHYARLTGNTQWNETATTLWTEIDTAWKAERLPLNFKRGLWGIGWAILYLYLNNMADRVPTDFIRHIDRKTLLFDASRCEDYSLDTGLGGLFAYYSVRRLYTTLPLEWPADFCNSLGEAARKLLKNVQAEVCSCCFAMQYIDDQRHGCDREDLPPSLHDWMEFPTRLATDSKFWDTSLPQGCLGAGLLAMLVLQKQNEYEHC